MYNIILTCEEGSYYLKALQKNRKLVMHTPDFARGDNDDFFVVTGNWEERDEEGRSAGLHVPHAYGRPPSPFLPSRATLLLHFDITFAYLSYASFFLLCSSQHK